VALQLEILPDADAVAERGAEGADKVDALRRLGAGDESIHGRRVSTENAVVIADEAAAGETQEDT
jgi:hypothetical protein